MCVCVHGQVGFVWWVHACTHAQARKHARARARTHTHTHTHTHRCICSCSKWWVSTASTTRASVLAQLFPPPFSASCSRRHAFRFPGSEFPNFSGAVRAKEPCGQSRIGIRDSDPGFRKVMSAGTCLDSKPAPKSSHAPQTQPHIRDTYFLRDSYTHTHSTPTPTPTHTPTATPKA